MPDGQHEELAALQAVIAALQGLEPDARQRIFDSAATFLQLRPSAGGTARRVVAAAEPAQREPSYPSFSTDATPSAKDFMYEKQPRTDIERMAALAYYLTHYRDTPQFKTLDLSKLNTEAAQPKFSNSAYAANNAVKRGFLIPTTRGQRQLSAAGERFIAALPDRDEAHAAMAATAPRRKPRKASAAKKKS
jgi:hypothetical protein